jgi:hypothetical protein
LCDRLWRFAHRSERTSGICGRQCVELAQELLGALCSRAQLRPAPPDVGSPAIAEELSTAVCSHVLLVAVDQRQPVDRTSFVWAASRFPDTDLV